MFILIIQITIILFIKAKVKLILVSYSRSQKDSFQKLLLNEMVTVMMKYFISQ